MEKDLHSKHKWIRKSCVFAIAVASLHTTSTLAQTNNGSYTTGNANPTASVNTSTTGGTNINYQTNNQWSNEQGFGPGIFCRSPTFYMGASTGQNLGTINDTTNATTNSYTGNYGGNIGILVPFGSSINQDCKELVKQIVLDRKISNQLSMIRACASLEREGIKIDPDKFPLLAICVNPPKPTATMIEDKKAERAPIPPQASPKPASNQQLKTTSKS